ncbi:MAG: rhomboid family intramembrane serine protease [Acidimicrobiales bacterium]
MVPLRDRNPTRRTAWVTLALIVINVAVFAFAQQAGSTSDHQTELIYERAAIPCEILHQRPITFSELRTDTCDDTVGRRTTTPFPDKQVDLAILVSLFLHASWLHLGGNMLFLWIFGNNVEDALGPLRYLAFYVMAGLVATLAQLALDPGSTAPLIGASGAIAGVMGAYLVWFPRARILTWLSFLLIVVTYVPAWLVLGFWFVSQFFTAESSGVAWMAHVGGFAFGALVAAQLRNTEWFRRRLAAALPHGFVSF